MDAEKIKFRVGQKPFTIQWLNLIWLFFIPLRVHRVSRFNGPRSDCIVTVLPRVSKKVQTPGET